MTLKNIIIIGSFVCCCLSSTAQTMALKDAYRDFWRTCVSVNQWQVKAENTSNGSSQTSFAGLDQTADW